VYTHPSKDRQIDFYLADNGTFGTIEKRSLDSAGPPLTAQVEGLGIDTLSELFLQVAPGHALPSELIDADARALELREAASTTTNLREATGSGEAPPSLEYEPEVSRQTLQSGCSSDLFDDDWGASWFRQNYCYLDGYGEGGCASASTCYLCSTNRDTLATETSGSNPTEIHGTVFNGDFNVSGRYEMWYRTGSWPGPYTWHKEFFGALPPRNTMSIHWYGLKWLVKAFNSCPHNGAAKNWNLP
jgi:hypothetical protein